MGKYNTHVNKWISWDNLNELDAELDALKKEVLTEVQKTALTSPEEKTEKKASKKK